MKWTPELGTGRKRGTATDMLLVAFVYLWSPRERNSASSPQLSSTSRTPSEILRPMQPGLELRNDGGVAGFGP